MITDSVQVLSCIQPTADIHIGNFFGAIQNWVSLQNRYRCAYGVVDLHAMTTKHSPADLQAHTRQLCAALLACGIDTNRSILFVQSLVPQHLELAWILSCLCPYGDLTRMTQFKDKSSAISSRSESFISAGLFFYPVLQAADILIYRAKYVPVGEDQRQHLELTANLARRLNDHCDARLPVPEPLFTSVPKVMSLADPQKKMSKSLGDRHCISLFEEDDVIRQKIRAAVTDTGPKQSAMSAGVANLFRILRACGNEERAAALYDDYTAGKSMYAALKESVAEALITLVTPFRARRKEILTHSDLNVSIQEGSARARDLATTTIRQIRGALRFLPLNEAPIGRRVEVRGW